MNYWKVMSFWIFRTTKESLCTKCVWEDVSVKALLPFLQVVPFEMMKNTGKLNEQRIAYESSKGKASVNFKLQRNYFAGNVFEKMSPCLLPFLPIPLTYRVVNLIRKWIKEMPLWLWNGEETCFARNLFEKKVSIENRFALFGQVFLFHWLEWFLMVWLRHLVCSWLEKACRSDWLNLMAVKFYFGVPLQWQLQVPTFSTF